MRPKYLATVLVLLALVLPAVPAHAGGVVGVCDESHLLAALSGGGTVTFTCSGTITLTSTINIAENTTIDGSGQTVTISGGDAVRVFHVNDGVTLTLDELTIAHGRLQDWDNCGAGISGDTGSRLIISNSTFSGNSAPTGAGGAIYLFLGSLTVTDSTFSGNTGRIGGAIYGDQATLSVTGSRFNGNGTASTDGAAIASSDSTLAVINSAFESNTGSEGGAIWISGGSAIVTSSTFDDNGAGLGGALNIFPDSAVVIDKCTISRNRASVAGGGIYDDGAHLELINSTVWSNLGTNRGGGIANTASGIVDVRNSTIANNGGGAGGGIYNASGGYVGLTNTIVANSSSGGNCSGTILGGGTDISYPDATCPGINADPRLDPLQNNGGPTKTLSPAPGSPAIDAGDDVFCPSYRVDGLDQRGIPRLGQGAHCDIGAYEVAHYRVTKTQDDNGECTATDCSLREAIIARNAAPGHDAIDVPAGTYQLTLPTFGGQDAPGIGDLDITDDLTIQGEGAGAIIHQSTADRVIEIPLVAGLLTTVKMSNLTFESGFVVTSSGSDSGGGILNRGELTLLSCKVQNNIAEEYGGGVFSAGHSLTVENSTFSGNQAGIRGAGIYNDENTDLTVANSTFAANYSGEWGGGIYNIGKLTVSNSTFYNNTADMIDGGGIANLNWVKVTNSTFSNNWAGQRGGGISSNGQAEMINVTLSGNRATLEGGALINRAGDAWAMKLKNTIAANSTAGGNCAGALATGVGNLSYPDATCGGKNVNPLLGALQNNGGPTPTMALGAGSPAIDAGMFEDCQDAQLNNRDQRGYARYVDGNGDKLAACDIGAYEYGSTAPPPPPGALDPDPPVTTIELTPAQPDGTNGWHRSPVNVTPEATDASPVIDLRCALDPAEPPAAFDDLPVEICPFLGGAQVTTDGEHTFYAAAVDIWGNKSAPVSASFNIDATPPVLTCPAAGPFLLHSGEHSVGPAGVDASVSGLDEAASTLTGVVTTESAGPKTLTFTAFDLAGNSASQECAYNVIYDFGGFYPPVEPAPTLNEAKAGQAVPLKFSLGGDQGLDVIADSYPASQGVDCESLEPIGSLEPTEPPGGSGLSYAAGNGWYNTVWKTEKTWAGGCRALVIQLIDGTEHQAYFRFE